jgi:hypothetical protein
VGTTTSKNSTDWAGEPLSGRTCADKPSGDSRIEAMPAGLEEVTRSLTIWPGETDVTPAVAAMDTSGPCTTATLNV